MCCKKHGQQMRMTDELSAAKLAIFLQIDHERPTQNHANTTYTCCWLELKICGRSLEHCPLHLFEEKRMYRGRFKFQHGPGKTKRHNFTAQHETSAFAHETNES